MLFFPYKLDISLYRIPFLTILVCVICVATFTSQLRSASAFEQDLRNYCSQQTDPNLRAMLDNIRDDQVGSGCAEVFMRLREVRDRDEKFAQLAREVRGLDFYRDKREDIAYKEASLRAGFAYFDSLVPKELTDKLAYRPDRYDVVTMLTSTFAHANWDHLLGNLVFFFIFASCVECALGALQFAVAFVVMAVATSLAYSHSVASGEALPAIGLSGVAMGMMALLTTLLPRAKIWCFFWFFLYVKRFTLPVLVIAAWHIGWNIYDLSHHAADSHINYVAHVSGAAAGVALGILYRLLVPDRLEQLAMNMGS